MDRESLCDSLITWLRTFNLDADCNRAEELSDGIAMAQALQQISPDFFTDEWMSKIKTDCGDNWRLKVSNLKKILNGILAFYNEELGQQILDFQMPNVAAIGEMVDTAELGRLLQLILGCAVNCEDKQEYIQRIMALEESVQHSVMAAIQELMTKEAPTLNNSEGLSELSEQLKRAMDELNSVMEEKEVFSQRCHELDLQVAQLIDEKSALVSENERMSERLHQADGFDDPETPAGRRLHQAQQQVDKLKDEIFRLEAARDDYRMKAEQHEREALDLQTKNDELTSLAQEARQLKDEVDVLRDSSDKVAKYEATIEAYKKKLDELSDLRRQVKLLEDKNTNYMQASVELEEELRRANSLKSQIEMYKRQLQELQGKVTEETKRADKSEFEIKRLQEKMQAIQREKDRIVAERDSLRETNEELRLTQFQQGLGVSSFDDNNVSYPIANELGNALFTDLDGPPDGTMSSSPGSLEMMSVPPEIKEKIIRLQHENKMLKLSQEGNEDENSQLTKTLLEDVQRRNNELETENRLANQRILELEANVEDLQEKTSVTNDGNDGSSELRKKLQLQMQKISSQESELEKKRSLIDTLEPQVSEKDVRLKELQQALDKKTDEMKLMEERYKKYLEKAKSVIKALEPKHNSGNTGEVQILKNQLEEKTRYIEHLERDQEKNKQIREQEEKLVVSAWYNLGTQLHRKAVEDRLSNASVGQSFLARQRQAHTRRIPNASPGAVTSPPSIYLES